MQGGGGGLTFRVAPHPEVGLLPPSVHCRGLDRAGGPSNDAKRWLNTIEMARKYFEVRCKNLMRTTELELLLRIVPLG
jgi:hypothetical protein